MQNLINSVNQNELSEEKGRLFKLTDQYHDSAILHFANKTKLFNFLIKPKTLPEIANHFGWIENKTKIFLNTLRVLKLIEKEGEHYQNLALTNTLLVDSSPHCINAIIEHQYYQWQQWNSIDEVLISKNSLPFQQENKFSRDAMARNAFVKAMEQLSQDNCEQLVLQPEFSQSKFVIDLAGGHGNYLLRLALKYPTLCGEIWDLEPIKARAEENIATHHLTSRIAFRAIDIMQSKAFDKEADTMMLNDCLHYFSEQQITTLLTNIKNNLKKSGLLVILSMHYDEAELQPASAAMFSFNMMLNTLHGQLHSTVWIEKQLISLGFEVTTTRIGSLGRYNLIKAIKL